MFFTLFQSFYTSYMSSSDVEHCEYPVEATSSEISNKIQDWLGVVEDW